MSVSVTVDVDVPMWEIAGSINGCSDRLLKELVDELDIETVDRMWRMKGGTKSRDLEWDWDDVERALNKRDWDHLERMLWAEVRSRWPAPKTKPIIKQSELP